MMPVGGGSLSYTFLEVAALLTDLLLSRVLRIFCLSATDWLTGCGWLSWLGFAGDVIEASWDGLAIGGRTTPALEACWVLRACWTSLPRFTAMRGLGSAATTEFDVTYTEERVVIELAFLSISYLFLIPSAMTFSLISAVFSNLLILMLSL